jgi:hypothetical protein
MISGTELMPLQIAIADRVLSTVLQGATVAGFIGVSALAAHLLVRAFRTEGGSLRVRDAQIMLAGASLLFVTGFTNLVVSDGAPSESLAAVALGFAGVAYLLYTRGPELFERADRDETPRPLEDTSH